MLHEKFSWNMKPYPNAEPSKEGGQVGSRLVKPVLPFDSGELEPAFPKTAIEDLYEKHHLTYYNNLVKLV